MSSNLIAAVVILSTLAGVALLARPEPKPLASCCQVKGHETSEDGEIIYCAFRGY